MIGRKINLADFGLVLPTADITWILGNTGGGGGGSGDPPTFDSFSSLCNGVTVTFNLSATPASNQTVILVHNGLVLERGNAYGYTLTGTTITMANAPLSGDSLVAWTFTA